MHLEDIKSKYRYEINAGIKRCDVKRINSYEYADQLFDCFCNAVANYKKTDIKIDKKLFVEDCLENENNKNIEYYGVFKKESNQLIGYGLNKVYEEYVEFITMKFHPDYLKLKGSAALNYTMIVEYMNRQKKKYINDGNRSIRHETNFQDYLIKYFGFRKAYCDLHIHYNTVGIKQLIYVLFPFRKILYKSNQAFIHNIASVLKMEAIRRGKDS